MLMGKYNHAVDAKGRLIIPAKLKEQLGARITVIRGTDPCLTLFSEEEWQLYAEKISALPHTQGRVLTRYLYSHAQEIEPDAQGRVLLTQEMLQFAGITKNVVTVGCGRYVEIWAAEQWEEGNLDEEPLNFAEELEKLGL